MSITQRGQRRLVFWPLLYTFLCLVEVIAFSGNAKALNPHRLITQYVHRSWTRTDGLPADVIWATAQTPDGYMWFGTSNGLLRFDGVQFKVYDSHDTPAFKSNDIRSLLVSHNGALWIGTYGAGAIREKNGVFTRYTTKQGLAQNLVYDIYQDKNGNLWFATGAGLSEFSHGHFKNYTKKNGLPSDRVYRVIQGPKGAIWAGTLTGGLARLAHGHITTYNKKDGLASNQIHSLFVTNSGKLLVGVYGGALYWYHKGHFTNIGVPKSMAGNGIESIVEGNNGTLWLGSYGGGLIRDDHGHFSRLFGEQQISSDYVFSLFFGKQGSLWVGTRNGLNQLRNGYFLTYGRPEGLANSVFDVYQSASGAMWIGSEGKGLYGWKSGKISHLTTLNGLTSNSISALCGDGHGGLWIGTFGGGLDHYNRGLQNVFKKKNGLASNYVFAIMRAHNGSLWVATDGGVSHLVNGQVIKTYTHQDGLPNALVRVLYQSPSGKIWFGTNGGGLVSFYKGHFKDYTTADGLGSNLIYALYQGQNGELWIGTRGGGLSRLKNGQFYSYSLSSGFPENSVYAIVPDRAGNLWISSPTMLARVSIKQLNRLAAGKIKRLAPHTFNELAGLRSSQFVGGYQPSGVQAKDGTLWFPSTAGIVRVMPSQVTSKNIRPPVYITGVTANGRWISPTNGTIVLPAHDNDLQIHYTALNFIDPKHTQFRYRLSHFDSHWVNAGTRRVAYYTHLPPGEFNFTVIATTDHNSNLRARAGLTLYHAAYFYQTIWFDLLLGLATISLLILLYRFRVRQLKIRERTLTRLVKERTYQLEQTLERVEQISKTDDLTNIPNRRSLIEILHREWSRSSRQHRPLSLIMIDIDYFKKLNDSYGHQSGDDRLRAVAALLQAGILRSGDTVGRYGGEEFLVILPDTSIEAATIVAERLRNAVVAAGLEHRYGGIGDIITISAGVAAAAPDDNLLTPENLLQEADNALYKAKQNGRNQTFAENVNIRKQ